MKVIEEVGLLVIKKKRNSLRMCGVNLMSFSSLMINLALLGMILKEQIISLILKLTLKTLFMGDLKYFFF